MERICQVCSKIFNTPPCRTSKYCSRECFAKWRSQNKTGENNPAWRGGKVTCRCDFCKGTFHRKRSHLSRSKNKFCSRQCKADWQRDHNYTFSGENNPNYKNGKGRVTITKTCEVCNAKFKARKNQIASGQGRFCSRQCKAKAFSGENSPSWAGGPIEKKCKHCNKTIFASKSRIREGCGRFCSRLCKGAWLARHRSGENSVHWLGGKSFEPYPPEFNNQFKKMIRQRDGNKCALCSKRAKCVHHINYIKEDTIPENCITLCRSCHSKTNTNRDYWKQLLSPIALERCRNGRQDSVTISVILPR